MRVRAIAGIARQEPGRLRQQAQEQQRGCQWDHTADRIQRAPSQGGEDAQAEHASQRSAQRNTHDGQGHGERAMPPRHVFGSEGGRVGQRAPQAQPAEEPQYAQGSRSVHGRAGHGQQAEHRDAADERRPPSDPIAHQARAQPADHHAHEAAGKSGGKRAARYPPLAHHGGNGHPQ